MLVDNGIDLAVQATEMTPASFSSWRVRLYGERGQTAAAKALGCSKTSILAWERGWVYNWQEGAGDGRLGPDDKFWGMSDRPVPIYIALAAAALEANLPPAA